MTKLSKLLKVLDQTFIAPSGASSTVKPLHQAFDAEEKGQVVILQYRFKSDIDSSPDLEKLISDRSTSKPESQKRLLNVITGTLAKGGKWPR